MVIMPTKLKPKEIFYAVGWVENAVHYPPRRLDLEERYLFAFSYSQVSKKKKKEETTWKSIFLLLFESGKPLFFSFNEPQIGMLRQRLSCEGTVHRYCGQTCFQEESVEQIVFLPWRRIQNRCFGNVNKIGSCYHSWISAQVSEYNNATTVLFSTFWWGH